MSDSVYPSLTQHAMLVAWGQYAHCLGLIAGLEAVSLHQKAVKHQPQTKLERFHTGQTRRLQEQFAVFAANLVSWAAHWLATQCPQLPEGWQEPGNVPVKQQVQVVAHTSAWVTWHEQGCLLTFTDHSVFAGRSLQINRQRAYQRVLPFTKSCVFSAIRAP